MTTEVKSPTDKLDEHVAPELRDRNWKPAIEQEADEAAKERSTCSNCLARTYRQEECICDPDRDRDTGDPEDCGDAEDYDEAYEDELSQRTMPIESVQAAAGLYDPHGNHVEYVQGNVPEIVRQVSIYVERMAAEGYPCSIIIEPAGAGE